MEIVMQKEDLTGLLDGELDELGAWKFSEKYKKYTNVCGLGLKKVNILGGLWRR
jgi:hypothetical protein